MEKAEVATRTLDALRLLNNCIVTRRMYPPGTPQVSMAGDRAFKGLQEILHREGPIEYSLIDGRPYLNGILLTDETLSFYPNLVIYRQLEFLGRNRLHMAADTDHFAFEQLVTAMSASRTLVENSGGADNFLTTLGLKEFFPVEASQEQTAARRRRIRHGQMVGTVRPDLIACALGEDDRPLLVKDLHGRMENAGFIIDLLHACTARILHEIREQKRITATASFSALITLLETQLEGENRALILDKFSSYLAGHNLRGQARAALLAQEYVGAFGASLYETVLNRLKNERFREVVTFYRERAFRLESIMPGRGLHLEQSLKRMLATEAGRRWQGSENALNLVSAGEKERRKKRIAVGIKRILSGEEEVLGNEEMLQYLPLAIGKLNQDGRTDAALALLARLRTAVTAESGKVRGIRSQQVGSLLGLGELLLDTEGEGTGVGRLMTQVSDTLCGSLLAEIDEPELFTRTGTLLCRMMNSHWDAQRFVAGDRVLTALFSVRTGKLKHPMALREIMDKVQNETLDRAQLGHLLHLYLESDGGEAEGNRLLLQGPIALRFLVDSVMQISKEELRDQLITLGSRYGGNLSPYIHERLPGHMPWFAKRNLLKLLGKVGSEADADLVMPWFSHTDLRVQREAFLTLNAIGGRHRRSLFLKALGHSTEKVQQMLVQALAEMGDREVALKMEELLQGFGYFSETEREPMLLVIIDTLSRCNCPEGLEVLERFLENRSRKSGRLVPETVWKAAERAGRRLKQDVKSLKEQRAMAQQIAKNAMKQAARMGRQQHRSQGQTQGEKLQPVITGLPLEEAARKVLAEGRIEEAHRLVLELLGQVLRSKNFAQARSLKEWMVEIDARAVSTIVQADDMIREEQRRSVLTSHLDVWDELYKGLSSDEVDELFNTFIHRRFELGETVVAQGDQASALFFINAGRVRFFYVDEDHDEVVKVLGPGEVFGLEVFFDASVWTLSAETIESADISQLRYDRVLHWRSTFPGLDRKLEQFCDRFESVQVAVQGERNRRLHERFAAEGVVGLVLLDAEERPLGLELSLPLRDLSCGGLSCEADPEIDRDDLRQLLGQKVTVSLPGRKQSCRGDIMAVRIQREEGEPTIHVSFTNLLSEAELTALLPKEQ